MIAAGAGVAAVLALGAAGIAAMRSGDDDSGTGSGAPVALPAASPSGAGTTAPEQSPPALPVPAATSAPPTRRSAGAAEPARTPSSRATTVRTTAPPVLGRSSAPVQGLAPGARPASPAADRTGVIHGPGPFCLDLNGNVPSDGNFVQVFDCNGTTAQVWTVGADQTLRVDGRCAQSISGDNTVQIVGCDGRGSTRWRVGSGGTLINVSTGLCLTDPANGGNRGSAVRLNACTTDPNQRWDLP